MSITPGIVAGLLITEEERKRKEKEKPKGLTGKSGNPGNPGEGREEIMAEERKVSPLVIAGIGVGVAAAAAIGLYALARAAPEVPEEPEEPEEPGVWETSEVTIHRGAIPTYAAFMRAEITVTNISTATRVCTIAPYLRHKYHGINWVPWYESPIPSFAGDPYEDIMEEAYQAQTILSVTLAPGETGVLSAVFYGGICVEAGWINPEMQVRFIGPFGVVDSAVFDMIVTA